MNKALLIPCSLALVTACFASDSTKDSRVAEILALDSDAAYGEYLASECSTCHNDGSTENGIPTIAGQEPGYLIQAMLEYQDEKRANETMRSVAGALNNEEIGALALYFSSQ